jgi:restriction endonuclease S subunit
MKGEMRQPVWLKPEEVPLLPEGWRAIPTEDACVQLKPGKLFETKTVSETGTVPVLNQSETDFLGYHDEEPGVDASPERPVVTFANHTCAIRVMKRPFSTIQNIFPKVGKPGVTDTIYFYYASLGRVGLSDYKGHHPIFRQAHIPVPPLPIQRRIAGILSAYDELIENSQRRIRILESMARALYREWFVHFRFPGHETHPRVASSLGLIPEGWEVKSIQQFGAVITGKTPSKANADFYGNDVPFVKTPDMHGNMFILGTSDRLSPAGAKSQANKTLPAGSICVSCIGTIGVISITTEACQTNQQINSVVLAYPDSREFLFLRLQDAKQTLENLGSNGATMGNVNKSKFEAMEIVCPSEDLLARYHRIVEPMFSEILSLFRQIQNLRRTRDLLLPRLLSGQVELETEAA